METGYIFDLDGVITDTASFHYRSWKQLATELGFPFTRADNEALLGRSRPDALKLFLGGRQLPGVTAGELMERKNALFLDSIGSLGPADLLPGVADLLAEARAAGIHVGIGSASRNARIVCERLGILDQLDALGDGGSVTNPKPAPDIFIWVAGRFGLTPGQCLVFEDSAAGIEAALAGGFPTVGLGPAQRVGRAQQVRASLEDARVGDFPLPGRVIAHARQ